MTTSTSISRLSPLHSLHVQHGAVFTEVSGWQMVEGYGAVEDEIRAVSESAGVCDMTGRTSVRVKSLDLDAVLGSSRVAEVGSVVRDDDLVIARLAAEELGVKQSNVVQMRKNSSNAEVQRLLGVYGDFGLTLGLSNTWAYSIIRLVGNYDDVWKRNLSVVGLERGPNALWRDGGVMIALPFR